MNPQSVTIKSLVEEKINEFIESSNGRFREHVSDTFLKAYLIRKFEAEYRKERGENNRKVDFVNTAYNTAVYLFEILLIYGCGMNGNGHDIAGRFGQLFKEMNYQGNFNDEILIEP